MQPQAHAWIKAANSWARSKRKGFHRFLVAALIAPVLVTVSAPTPALANTYAAGTSCSQFITGATAVTVTKNGNSCVIEFRASAANGTNSFTWAVPSNASSVSILVIGGGGSGGTRHAAGGGAGGFVYRTGVSVTPATNVAISVGKGGDAVGTGTSDGIAGSASSFGAISAAGGGRGGQSVAGGAGGSGGGGCCSRDAGNGNTPALTPSQGNKGGVGTRGTVSEAGWSGGGGGGSGSAGFNSTSTASIGGVDDYGTAGTATGGKGGNGTINAITGSDVCYAAGGGGGVAASGGAGGAGGQCGTTTIGGRGGKGTSSTDPNRALQGVDATGSGGGGGGFEGGSNQISGRGGSGIVVVRYDLPVVTISANSGSGSPSATTLNVNSNNQVTLPRKDSLERNGYTFGGWNTATDGTGTNYAENATFTPTGNVTLHARWFPIATFNGNSQSTDASTVPAPINITSTSANNTLPIPYSLRKGLYRFGGWNTNSTGTGTNTNGSNVDIYDLAEPYLRLEAANYNTSTNVWIATNGANVPATKVKSPVNITKVTNIPTSGVGATETFTALRGTRASGIALGNAELSNGFTFCAVARPTNTQATGWENGGRLFDAVTGNWLVGWWGGYQGSFFHEGWMNNSTTTRNNNFHVICDRPAVSRFDGSALGSNGSGSSTLPEMSINNGNYTGGNTRTPAGSAETSDWEVAEIIVYDRTLVDADVLRVESYLKYRYGVTAATNGSYTLGSAAASYGTATPQTVFAQWNSVITFDTNSATTGTAPANQTITGTGAALSGNTGSLAKGALAFLGWYTNKTGSGGTFYAAGATYPNTGSKTLYAVYGPALAVSGGTTAAFSNGIGGRSETYTISGGVGARVITNTVSPANSGITLDTSTANSIVIRVSPTVATGIYFDTFTVRDDGFLVTRTITITVADPLIWSASNPTTVVTTYGKPSRTRLNLSGGTGTRIATLAHVSSPAPRFVTLDTSTIAQGFVTLITDTATAPGTYSESITVVDASNVTRTALLTITINSPPDIGYSIATDTEYPLISTDLFLNYDFNNLSSYSGTGTTINDLRGNAISGTVTSAGTFSNSGGGSFSLNGTNLATIRHAPLTNTQSFSKFLWIYPTSGTGSLINVCNTAACDSYHQSEFEMLGGVLYAAAYSTGTLNSGSNTVPLNQWSYVGFTWEYVSASLSYTKLYINGKLVGSRTNSGSRAAPPVNEFNLISDGDSTSLATASNGTFLFGAYHVYKAALNTTQIFANYSNTKTRFLSISPAAPTVSGNETLTVTEGRSTTFRVFTETGGTGTNTFSLSGLNSAISLASVGTDQTSVVVGSNITATSASQAKIYSETLTATDSSTAATAYYFTVVVNPKIVITTTSDTITTTFGRSGSTTLNVAANTGTGSSTFSRVSGSGSSAITATFTTGQAVLNVAGTLPGGTYYETLTATDSLGATTSKVIVIVVNPALTLTSATGVNEIETTFSRGTSLTINVANGTGTRIASALPVIISGVSLTTTNLQTGSIVLNLTSAVPVGTYIETITVTDSVSASASLVIRIIVNSAPTISFGGATSGSVTISSTAGRSFTSGAFTTSLGTGAKTLSVSGRNARISIDTSTANTGFLNFASEITAGTYSETVTSTDSLGVITLRTVTITINPAISLTATPASLSTTAGISATDTVTASNGTGNISFSVSISPTTTGISFTNTVANRAVISVANTLSAGSYTITLTATDSVSATASISIPLTVAPAISISGGSALTTTRGFAFTSPSYSASGGSGNTTYLLVSPPTGVSLSASTGSPSILVASTGINAGTYNLTLRATDSVSATSTFPVTLTVNNPVSLSGTQTITKNYGTAGTYVFNTSDGTGPFTFSTTNICSTEISTSGGITTERIMGVGSCDWQVPAGVTSLSGVLVVGGGGGGGFGSLGGGGGAGEVESSTAAISVTPGNKIVVTVGAGGNDGYDNIQGNWRCGSNGGNTVFGAVTALGGGAGAGDSPSGCVVNGTAGGSGGGGNMFGTGGASTRPTQTGWLSFGNAGGNGTTGGGGGAGSVGNPWSAAEGSKGKGGAGITLMGMTFAGGGGAWNGGTATNGNETGGSGGGGRARGGSGFPCDSCDATSGTGSGGGAGGRGGSGFIAIQYPTPSVAASTTAFTFQTISKSAPGQLRLTVPEGVPSDTYTATIRVFQDTVSNNTIVDFSYSVVIRVNRGIPTLALSIPGGGTSATYGSPVTISGTANTAGNFNFRRGGTTITDCGSRATSSGVATCTWTPTDTSTAVISAIFSPTDSSNWSSVTSTNLTLSVAQADTLTVTANNLSTTYSVDGSNNSNTTVPTRSISLSGLASIDSITAASFVFSGTLNTGASYASSAIVPREAGNYTITPSAAVFTSPALATNYRAVTYAPGTLTINRAPRGTWTISYGAGTNVITFGAAKIETPTIVHAGDGTRLFTTSSATCSVNSSTGVITTLGVGSCSITSVLNQSANWLSDTKTVTVTINRGLRTATIVPTLSTIKYGETTKAVAAVLPVLDSATVTYSVGNSLGCSIDNVTGDVTGIKAGSACGISVGYGQTDLYESATATASLTINKALAPIVSIETITALSYTGLTSLVSPTYRVTGILDRDILQILPAANLSDVAAISATSYSAVSSFKYSAPSPNSYDSTTAPTDGGTYQVTAQGLTLLSGVDLSNYENPNYVSSNLVINPIAQAPLRILLSAQESITVPYDITFAGGSSTRSITAIVVSGTSGIGCSVSGLRLTTSAAGTCVLQARKAADRNYLEVISDTATVTILNFVSNIDWNAVFNSGSGITITSQVPFTAGPITCEQDCQPTITDIQDTSGTSITSLRVGQTIWIIGTNFNTATEVYFRRSIPANGYQIDSDTKIVATIPSSIAPNPSESISTMTISISVVASGGRSFPNTQIVTVTL
jgi:uncharacterized repeat protein (TIGR02543 family)